ncbi:hypothetical protein FDP41_006629 [Naegleria fowleri]|uniref:AMP-dependent synthetase/ligase domain-containing protein n=1 Tax=Naegleria fowleri TaxID=5763 RepID=A0A6A5BBX5_NAEFO|nr:uncharacterized protein FDP41_006629 [Naegleria fowleri]KAF0974597.1 hypothetical protein FDP41_006629 [Naegleria fowleri]
MLKDLLLKFISFALRSLDRVLFFILRLVFGRSILPEDLSGAYDHLKSFSVEVDDPNYRKGVETKPRRRVGFEKELMSTPMKGIDTLNGLLDHVAREYPNLPMLGYRPFKRKFTQNIDGKDWEVFEMGDVVYETYQQVHTRIENLARGIARFTGLNSKDLFGIFEETRKEWLMTLHACMRYNITVMTVYATLGDESLIEAINECQLQAMLVNEHNLKKLCHQIIPHTPTLKYLIFTSGWDASKEETEKWVLELEKLGVKAMSFEEVEQLGKQETCPIKVKEPQTNSSLAVVMYTSGTTSKPKGVMLTVRNILAISAAAGENIHCPSLRNPTYIGYLPLAHILEMAAEHYILSRGGKIGYGNPRTLTDKTCKPVGDLEAIQPIFLAGVPRVYDTIRKGISEKVKTSSPIIQWLFKVAYDHKLESLYAGRDTPLFNFLIFRKIAKATGGKLRACLSGGAPLSKESQEHFRVCMGAAFVQGYGLTETAAAGTIMLPGARFATRVAGVIVPAVEIKLISVPEMNYTVDGPVPRGEIAIRGHAVSIGYYKQPEKTKEVFLEDGFFLTGDVGQFNENGTISIIDRVKNLVKLSHGEYIALERLESIYCQSPFVAPNGCMVYANSYCSFPCAIVIAQPGPTKRFAEENGITGTFFEICKNPRVEQHILKSLHEQAKSSHLKRYEEVKAVKVFDDVWSPENDLLTAAFKLKRANIVQKYRAQIDEMCKTLI